VQVAKSVERPFRSGEAGPVAQWVADSDAPACMRCNTGFTFFYRRHHCRKCGYVVCDSCSNSRHPVVGYDGQQRVCTYCYVRLTGRIDNLKADREGPSPKFATHSPNEDTFVVPSEETPILQITAMELFNILTLGSMMILDVRPKKDFEKQHLPRSVNIDISESTVDQYRAWSAWENSNENKKTKKDAENSATNFDSKTGESNSGVDTTQNIPEKPKIETIEAKLPVRARMSLRRRRMLNVVIVSSHGKENSKDHDKARTLASMIRNSRSLKVLTGGFQGFVAQYPFALTSPNLIPWYPTIVLDQFLYLGCEADARLLQHLEHLEVTHILNVSGEVKNLYPNRFEYLQINIPDLKSSQIQKHFEQAIEFINMVLP